MCIFCLNQTEMVFSSIVVSPYSAFLLEAVSSPSSEVAVFDSSNSNNCTKIYSNKLAHATNRSSSCIWIIYQNWEELHQQFLGDNMGTYFVAQLRITYALVSRLWVESIYDRPNSLTNILVTHHHVPWISHRHVSPG